eukprot:Selendium_serpulae@DN5200_c0_g1_i1.p1
MRRRNIYQALLIATLVGAAFAQEANIRSVQAAADVVDAAKDSEEAEEDIADELPVGAANASEPEAKAGGVKAQSATGLKETEMTGCCASVNECLLGSNDRPMDGWIAGCVGWLINRPLCPTDCPTDCPSLFNRSVD